MFVSLDAHLIDTFSIPFDECLLKHQSIYPLSQTFCVTLKESISNGLILRQVLKSKQIYRKKFTFHFFFRDEWPIVSLAFYFEYYNLTIYIVFILITLLSFIGTASLNLMKKTLVRKKKFMLNFFLINFYKLK